MAPGSVLAWPEGRITGPHPRQRRRAYHPCVDNGNSVQAEFFETAAEWEAWLEQKHASSRGVWLRLAKKHSEEESIAFIEALDVALCYGWVDLQKQRDDDDWWLQRFTPRPASSKWGSRACERAEELIRAGRMKPAGQAEIDKAQADGRWEASTAPPVEPVPSDLQLELERSRRANASFAAIDAHNRNTVLQRLARIQRPEARRRKICELIESLERGQRIYS
jgi:uncharacterized protein YdeI (YjbR/CyaY-like superfamily)